MTTAHHWRDVRQFIRESGIADPMGLPSMHALIDYTEKMAKQAMASGGDRAKAEAELNGFNQRLYGPHAYETPTARDGRAEPAPTMVPTGFDDPDEVESAFDAFAQWAGAAR